MNSRNSKTSESFRLLLDLSGKIKKDKIFQKVINMLLYQILAYNIHEKI